MFVKVDLQYAALWQYYCFLIVIYCITLSNNIQKINTQDPINSHALYLRIFVINYPFLLLLFWHFWLFGALELLMASFAITHAQYSSITSNEDLGDIFSAYMLFSAHYFPGVWPQNIVLKRKTWEINVTVG